MRPFDPALLRAEPATRRPLAALGALGVVSGVLAIAQAISIAALVVAVVRGHSLVTPAVAVLVVLALRGLVSGCTESVAAWAGSRVAGLVRRSALARWLAQPVDERPDETVMLTRSTQGAQAIEPYVARYLPALVAAAVVPVLVLVALTVTDWVSAVIVVCTLPLLPLFAALIGMYTRDETQARWVESDRLAGHFVDVMRGLPTLVGYQRAEHQVSVVAAVGERHRRATVRTLRTAFLSSAALEMLATISVAIVAVAVGLRLVHGEMGLQVGLTAILLAPEAYWPIRRVGQEFHSAAEGVEALGQLLDLETDTEAPVPAATTVAAGADAADEALVGHATVSVVGLGYTYPRGRSSVIRNLDFVCGTGLTVITGPSGCGKTTLLDLLAQVRRPVAGSVRLKGGVHYVTQRPFLAPATLRANLELAGPMPGGDEWLPAPLRELPDGLDTVIGDDGFGLSAGQRALLAITRAQLSDAPIVLLDEPTAHLDTESREQVHDLIRTLAQTRTVIVVSHSAELIALADKQIQLTPVADPDTAVASTALPVADSMPRPTEPEPVTARLEWMSLWRPARGVWRAAFVGALASICGVALTATSGWLIVQASTKPPVLTLLVAIVCVRAFGIGRPVFRYFERIRSHDAALGDLAERRTSLYARLIPLTPARLGRRRRADVLTAAVRDLDDEVDVQVRALVPLVAAALAAFIAVVVALFLSPLAGLVLLAVVLAAGCIAWLDLRLEWAGQRDALETRAEVGRRSQLIAANVSGLQAISAEASALADADRAQRAAERATSRQARGRAFGIGMTTALMGVAVVAMAGVMHDAISSRSLEGPVAALLILGPLALTDLFGTLPDAVGALARGRQARARLRSLVDQEPAVRGAGAAAYTPGVGVPRLTTRELTASWDGEHRDLDATTLTVERGEHLALVGPNGFGKSTLLAVLARQLDPMSGSYEVDDREVRTMTLDQVRERIAIVDDEPHVFAGSLRANLTLARPDSTDQQIAAALVDAGLGRWLSQLPEGLDTLLGGGRDLSGGERARLSIARAILSKRPVVLLDEPVAHLDQPTAQAVMDDLHTATSGSSVVIVTHQASAERGCDRTIRVGERRAERTKVEVG